IVEMAGTHIENLHDMTFALQDHKPGDTIVVIVSRGGQRVTLKATLGDRPTSGTSSGAASATSRITSSSAPQVSSAATSSPTPIAASAATSAAASTTAAGGIAAFYKDRPGPSFVVGAGKPFEKSFEGEDRHLRDIRQLTFGGENAEAYFSPDGTRL